MAASDVYNALQAAITGADKQIDLWTAATGSPWLDDLVPVLGLFGIASPYVLTRANLAGGNTSVTLTASGQFGQPGAAVANSYAVTATLTYSDAAGFTLTLRVVDSRPWTFATFFPALPKSMRSNLDENDVRGIRWTTSFLVGSKPSYAVVLGSPSFSARSGAGQKLELEGFLPAFADPDIQSKLGLLSPWPLRLSGWIAMPASLSDYPLMELTAQGSSTNMLGGSTLPAVDGPDPIRIEALFIKLVVERLVPPQFGNTGMSTLVLGGQFVIGGGLSGTLTTQVLTAASIWTFHALFDAKTSSLTQGLASLSRMFGVELPVPMDFPLLSEFHFAEVDVEFRNDAIEGEASRFTLVTFALSIVSNRPWKPPVPFVTFKDVGIRWVWGSTATRNEASAALEDSYLLTGTVFGSVQFGGDGTQAVLASPEPVPTLTGHLPVAFAADGSVTVDVRLEIPSFYISGSMRTGDYIPIGKAFADYFGGTIPLVPANMNVTALSFTADPIGQVYQGQLEILFGTPEAPQPDQAWVIMQVGSVGISLQRLEMWVQARGGGVGGGISGVFFLMGAGEDAYDDPQLMVTAERPIQGEDAPDGWLFAAHLYPGTSIALTDMVARFIKGDPNYQVPSYVPRVFIDRLDATFATGTKAYTFGGTASMRWTPELFGTTLSVNASASADIARTGENAPVTGTASGSFAINKISILVTTDIGVAEPTYLFKVMFGELWVQAITAWRGDEGKRHQVVSVQLGGITLGDILEYLVNLAAPTLGFRLDPPWDLLKRVDLSRFVLTLDPQENIVEFVFNAQVDLGVMRVDTIGARYRRGTGQGKVELILTGNFFGQSYTTADPLSWDVVNESPPSVPGQGSKTVDLRFIGVGQRITFAGQTPDTVAAAVAALRKAMQPPVPGKDPVGTGLIYSDESQWLMGLDIGLMGMIDLGIIFNDPRLYGLSIALGGERAGSLAGLRFEILYKKITNDIGMYRIELRVPDAFRTIQLGAVSLTLGIVVIEIYTNGNFKIDLGFPYNRDYSRSFSLQAGIVIGRGGFYFGILNGDTSTSVPKITNGNFSPVIELGVGLSAGVGREISAGILSGGAYIQVEVIFQGVLAWFNPTGAGARSAMYFRAQGVVALHGKVYAKVDFVVISASVTLEAFAQAMVVFESYRPILLEFTVGVRAEASVKIIFIRISFHFSVTLQLGFTIGSASPTPWILADSGSGAAPRLAGSTRSLVWQSLPRHAQRKALMRHGYMTGLRRRRVALGLSSDPLYVLEWKPGNLVFSAQQTAHLTMLPYITVGQVPVDWSGATPANATPQYRVAFLLYADTGMAPDARTVADTAQRHLSLSGTDPLAADQLVSALLRYALYALPDGPTTLQDRVNIAQLSLLAEQIAMAETADAGFGMAGLSTFFTTNLHFLVGGVPSGQKPDEKGAMLFPMPPGLSWTSTQAGDCDFSTYNLIGSDYEAGVRAILDAYFPEGSASGPVAGDDPTAYESFASFVFRDFCQMLVKAAVNEAQKQFEGVKVTLTDTMSLAIAAKTFADAAVPCSKEAGDTLQSVAARLGATAGELLFLNPSIVQTIDTTAVGSLLDPAPLIGVSPEMLVQDNPSMGLVKSAWPLGDVSRAVGSPETTLSSLAALFHVTSVSSLFAYTPPPGDTGYALGVNPNLLQVGRSFSLPAQTFVPPATGGFSQAQSAALFFVRYANPDLSASSLPGSPDMPDWYAQAIAILNPSLASASTSNGDNVEIDPGTSLTVPTTYGDRLTTRAYVTVPGDTLHRIGSTLVLCQDAASLSEAPPLWATFQKAVVATGPNFSIPAWPLPSQTGGILIEPGDTAEILTRRLLIDASFAAGSWTYDWNAVSLWLGPAQVLSPMAVLVLPGASISSDQSFTFQTLSDTYGLSLSDIAARLGETVGLLPNPTTLTIRQLPVMTVQQIENGVLGGTSFAGVVNQSSQMLMSGLRLPGLQTVDGHVVPLVTDPQPLYDLIGQQFTLAVDTDPAHGSDVALALELFSHASWVGFGDTFTVEPSHDMGLLTTRHVDIVAHNPRLHDPANLQPGMVLFANADQPSLDFSFTNEQILAEAPATGLALTTVPATPPAPQALPLKGTSPVTYGFEHAVPLQTPQSLPIPVEGTPLAGYASLWPFPQGLLLRAAGQVATLYDVFAGNQPGATIDNARPLLSTTFGCQLSFRIRRMDDGSNRFLLLGVDTDQRELLLLLRDEILTGTSGSATRAFLAIDPAPNGSNAQGLSLLDATSPCFLIKTNLSTDSQPQPQTVRRSANTDPVTAVYYADFVSELANFLLLLWEGSVVGGTGYYVGFGKDLPGSAFDGQGVASVTLLAIAGDQQAIAATGRKLEPFNNCLLVAAGMDASIHSLYAEGADASDLSEVALTPPGSAGFSLTIDVPAGDDAESALQDRYNTLVFWCADASSPYTIPAAWTPALPKPDDGTNLQAWERQRLVRRARAAGLIEQAPPAPSPYWHYEQVIPFYRFTTAVAIALTQGLPDEANDPYRGFGDRAACPTPELTFCLSDLLGNHSQPPSVAGQGVVNLTVGYTDNLIALSQWPELTAYFEVTGSAGAARLGMQLALKAAASLPGPSQRGNGVADAARQQGEQYARVYYQLIQPGVEARLSTSLHVVQNDLGLAVDTGPLWRYAGGAYAYTSTAGKLGALTAAGTTLATLLTTYPVRYAEMAVANQDVPLVDLFATGSTVSVPAFVPFVAQRSLTDIYAQRPQGWPDPGSAAALFSLTQNEDLPFAIGAAFTLPATVVLSTGADPATPSLAQLASANDTNAASLAEQNAAIALFATMNGVTPSTPNVFVAEVVQGDGQTLTVQVPVVAGETDSFGGVQRAFALQGINLSLAQIGSENADIVGLLKASQTLDNATYIARAGDTPGSNHTGVSAQSLGAANATTPGIFDDGALVYFGSESLVLSDDTLDMVAQRYACPADRLLLSNATLACGSQLAVPGIFAWPVDLPTLNGLRVPYTVRKDDLLATVCTRFAASEGATGTLPVRACVASNAGVAGTLAKDVTIAITVPSGNVSITTPAIESFSAAWAQALAINPDTTLDQLADAIASLPGALQEGALLAMPLVRLGAACAPQDIDALYGVDGAGFSLANTATPALIASEVTLSLPDIDASKPRVVVVTKANDTFNSVIVRFALLGVATDAGAIALNNPDAALFLGQALALLPPVSVREDVSLGNGGPYPEVVFALDASLTLLRPAALIHPDFANDGPVARAGSPLPPHAQGDALGDGSLNFGPFVRNLTQALPNLRVGTAKVAGETSDLWCVDFSSTGIASVSLLPGVTFPDQAPTPRFFALSPLYDHVVTRKVEIKSLNDDGTLGDVGVPMNFMAIDVEPWAQRFLGDVDRFLAGAMATELYKRTGLKDTLASVIQSKSTLAGGIGQQLQGVFDYSGYVTPPDPHYAQGLTVARQTLTQQLYVSLLRAYDTSVVAQYDTVSTTPWSAGNAPVSLYGQAHLDGTGAAVGFASARTDFDPSRAFVSFFATVADPERHSWISGMLNYDYSHTEFDMTQEGVPQGYRASNWLSFSPLQDTLAKPSALSHTNPGALLAPIPLRTYPSLPTIRDQTSVPSVIVDPIPLNMLSLWTYRLTCSHEFAAQDSVRITTEFNLAQPMTLFAAPPEVDLFSALAQYMAVADTLWTLLDNVDGAAYPNAAKTFASLAASVAGTWSIRLPQDEGSSGPDDAYVVGDSYAFNARVTYSADGSTIQNFSLTREQAQPGPSETWPTVEAVLPDGLPVAMPASITGPNGATMVYAPASGTVIPASSAPTFRLAWSDISVSAFQNARARMLAVRNDDLLFDPTDPTRPVLPTSPAFLLKTAEITAASIVTPLIERSTPEVIVGADIGAALSTAIQTLFPPATRVAGTTASWGVFYSYELARDGDSLANSLISRLPVALYPNQSLDGTPEALAGAVRAWTHDNRPSTEGGGWLFNVILYSGLEQTARPLFSADLFYPLGGG